MQLFRCVAGVVLLAATFWQKILMAAAECPSDYPLQFSHSCLHICHSMSYDWCSAQQFCNSIGGRLLANVSTLLAIRAAFTGSAEFYWIGFTDLADERGTSEAGWLSTEGEVLPEVAGLWRPDNLYRDYSDADDCLVLRRYAENDYRVSDSVCTYKRGVVCEPQLHSFSAAAHGGQQQLSEFRRTPFPAVADKSPTRCLLDKSGPATATKADCSVACYQDARCKAFLFNTRTAACRQLLYSDAILEAEVQNDNDWEKFVR